MLDVEKFLIALRSHKNPDGLLKPIFLADTVQEEIKIIQAAIENSRREWVGLTDEEIEDEWEKVTGHSIFGGDRKEGRTMYISPDEVVEFSKTIEAKLKEKNT